MLHGRRRWRIGLAAILGGLAVGHFGVSIYLWAGYFIFDVTGHGFSGGTVAYFTSYAGPCVVLLLLSLTCTALGLMQKRLAWKMLCLLAVLSAAAFWYDASHKRYQLDGFIATTEYRQSGGKQHKYLTWWWYTDRWVREPAANPTANRATPPSQPATRPAMTVAQEVEYLIDTIATLEGATFIRNDVEHTAAVAATLMRYRWNRDKDTIKTAEDFVKALATKSSTTGKPYVIRFKDGIEVKSGDYLLKKLADLEKDPRPGAR
jgi:hypothetical protein